MAISLPLWYSIPREEDEADGSWIIRMACLYGVFPSQMMSHLRKLGVDEKAVEYASKAKYLKRKTRRWFRLNGTGELCRIGAYCPLCFARDFREGTMPYFRRAWQRSWRTSCPVDETPLFWWPHKRYPNDLMFPYWMAKCHWTQEPLVSERGLHDKFTLQLRLARQVRRWMCAEAEEAIAWQQQLEQEKMLDGTANAASWLVAGIPPESFRRVVADVITLLCDQLKSVQHQAQDAVQIPGPAWMFGRFPNFPHPVPDGFPLVLSSFADPAQRRTLITLAIRTLTSMAANPTFDSTLRILEVGRTSLTHSPDRSLLFGSKWMDRRARHWPSFALVGLQKSCGNRSHT